MLTPDQIAVFRREHAPAMIAAYGAQFQLLFDKICEQAAMALDIIAGRPGSHRETLSMLNVAQDTALEALRDLDAWRTLAVRLGEVAQKALDCDHGGQCELCAVDLLDALAELRVLRETK